MAPKSKSEPQQHTAKTVLDDTAQQPNGGAPESPATAPGATDSGDGQPAVPMSASVTGPSSTDTSGSSASEVPQPNSSGLTSSNPAPGATDTGASSTDTPGPSTVGDPELPRYQVTGVSSIQHDGSWYEAGDDIYLSDHDARGLLDGRFIVPTQEF
jgi:hypothetical protein